MIITYFKHRSGENKGLFVEYAIKSLKKVKAAGIRMDCNKSFIAI